MTIPKSHTTSNINKKNENIQPHQTDKKKGFYYPWLSFNAYLWMQKL